MIPKKVDFTNPGNGRPLAIPNITYKICPRIVYTRVKPILSWKLKNPRAKLGFVPLLVWVSHSRSSKIFFQCLWNCRSKSFFLSPVRVTSILKGHGERIVLHKDSQYFTNADTSVQVWCAKPFDRIAYHALFDAKNVMRVQGGPHAYLNILVAL